MTKILRMGLLAMMLVFAGAAGNSAWAKTQQELAIELMEMVNSVALMRNMWAQTYPELEKVMRALLPDAPEEYFVQFKQEIDAEFQLMIGEAKIFYLEQYSQRFSAQELADLVAFYKTETGKKAISVMPELMAAGVAWGQKRGNLAGQRAAQRSSKWLKSK